MKHRLTFLSVFLVLLLTSMSMARASVVINEIMYHPPALVDDEDEFLELYNPDLTPQDLSGWCIDGLDFCFPSGASIAAGDYLVLASNATRFQTVYGFAPDHEYGGQLRNSGETLTLLNSLGMPITVVTYEESGLWPPSADGEGPSLELIDPASPHDTPRNWASSTAGALHTAGAANSVAAVGLPPWITNVSHGTVAASTPIVVTATVEDATAVSLTYKLNFDAEVTVAMLDDGLSGDGAASDGVYGGAIPGQPVETLVRYRVNATGTTGAMQAPRTDDTVHYLGTLVEDPALTSQIPIFHWWIDPADYAAALGHAGTDELEPAVLYVDGVLYDNIGIRVRGQSSRSFPKHHWQFEFPQGHKLALAELPAPVDNFNAQGNWADKSHLREILGYETFEAAGVPASLAFHFRMQQNGGFYGLYTFVEQPDEQWLERVGLDTEGAHYKAFDDCRKRTLNALTSRYEKKSREWENYSDLLNLVTSLSDLSGTARRNWIFDNIDLPRQVSYLAASVLVHSNDQVAKNYYLYRDTEGTGRWFMQPWDMDLTFGRNFNGAVLNDVIWADNDVITGRANVSPSHPLYGDATHQKYDFVWNRCTDRFHAEPEVREMFYRRLRTLMDSLLVSGVYEDRITDLQGPIAPEAALDKAEWGQYGQSQTLATAIAKITGDYLPRRRTHLFTTHRVAGEVPPAQSVAPPIVISEIMYNPIGGGGREFVELYNPSASESVDLSGWTLEGVDLTIPDGTVILPQRYALLVKDDPEFRTTYGGGKFIPGEYPGDLSNGGESLVLRDALGTLIDQVDYDDAAPWPTLADGGGPSLELIDPAADNNDPANWGESVAAGGTPGAVNSAQPPLGIPDLRINEVLAVNVATVQDEANDYHPWIEIYNADSTTVDLGNLYLTNDLDEPTMWRIPDGTSLCAGCWLIAWADGETTEGLLHTNFTLAAGGGEVGLFTADSQLVSSLAYAAQTADVSWGRLPDGGPILDTMQIPTPAAANQSDPLPIILNEYNAVNSDGFLKSNGSDTYWGRILGNGGDWFELVVTVDHLDMRGWQLTLSDDTGGSEEDVETLTLTHNLLWADLRAGTILTFAEDLADDVSFDPSTGDWWINIQASNAGSGLYVNATNIKVSNNNWQLAIKDAQGNLISGPAGEGIQPVSGIGGDEVFKLEEDPSPEITPFANYKDGSSSSFGSANLWNSGADEQDFTLLRDIPLGDEPVADITSATPPTGDIPLLVNFSASGSTDADGTVVAYHWEFGDGATGSGVSPSHTYTAIGTYTVVLKVTDNDGLHGFATTTLTATQPPQVLFVTNSTSLGTGDTAVQNRLLGQGYGVVVKNHSTASTADASGKVLIVISSTVNQANVNTKFRDVTVPVLSWDSSLFDDMKMTGTTSGTHYGTQGSQTQVKIFTPAHPIAAGLASGNVTVVSSSSLNWGSVGAGGVKIATVASNTNRATIFAYDTGAAMVGMNAPARRVGFFLSDTNATTLNGTGWALFDAAVAWAVGP